jgi:hypothetical protein
VGEGAVEVGESVEARASVEAEVQLSQSEEVGTRAEGISLGVEVEMLAEGAILTEVRTSVAVVRLGPVGVPVAVVALRIS